MYPEYDNIGAGYEGVRDLPVGSAIEEILKQLLGNVNGLRVLDLGSGTGYFSKKLVELGAREVVGLDISQVMLDEARRKYDGDDRLSFYLADATKPFDLGKFDLVLAMFSFMFTPSEEEHQAMWQNVASSLVPGGRIFGVVVNPDAPVSVATKLGLTARCLGPVKGGRKFRLTLDTSPPTSFHNFLIDRDIFDKCAAKVGMHDLQWTVAEIEKDDPIPYLKGFQATYQPLEQ